MLTRQRYKLASEGDLPAIRIMLRMISANLKGRKETRESGEITRGGSPNYKREPRNADMAMVILGIAGFDNAALAAVGLEQEDCAEWRVRGLRPNRIERWVIELAENEGLTEDAYQYGKWWVVEATISEDRSDVRVWDSFRERVISRLMGLYAPGATRFKPGVSGNRRGRPRKYPPAYPYDDFLTEAVTLEIKGELRTMTRLDALLVKLATMALKDSKIADLVLGLTMQRHELDWNKVEECGEIIRG